MSVLNHMNQSFVSGISSLIFLRKIFEIFFNVGIITACVNYAHLKHLKEIFYLQKLVIFIAFSLRRHMLAKHKSAALLMFPGGQFFRNRLKLANFEVSCVCSYSIYILSP